MDKAEEMRVRELRDFVLESGSTEENWVACRENWLRPDSVRWLEKKAAEMKEKTNG